MNVVLSPHERDVLAYRGDLNSTRRTITEQFKNKTQKLVGGCLFAFTEMNGIKSNTYDYTRDGFTWRTCLSVKVNMEAHLVYTLCSADAIYTYFGIGGDGMLDAGSATPSMMGAEGNVGHPLSKRRRSDD